jgi:site-specific DNA recombinase
MQDGVILKNGVAAIRVSTTKQGTDGDSPDAQREQIERFAKDKGIRIKKYFVFLESASKEQQPMQEAVDYCIDPKNDIELFIIKSIDRFTRGGSLSYDILKDQLDKHKVNLVDIYGVIRSEKVNTLHHLGFEYKWSVFSPSKKSEILEAERSKDELRDIMSRMIGAEIRYTQMGYWMRKAPFGYMSEKIDTQHGKRTILRPHPKEAKFITKMFELRASGNHSDKEIAQILNDLGYATRMKYVHSRTDPSKVIKQSGGNVLNDRHLWRMLRNPIYAGVNMEKWTNLEPVQCVFKGIVSVELFNKANAGRRTIFKNKDGKLVIHDTTAPHYAVVKGVRNPDFPYKKFVMCPECNKPLLGSASRGKSGKYYPAYHCNKRGHNFRVSKQDLEDSVLSFISGIKIAPDKLDDIFQAVESAWERSNATYYADLQAFDTRIEELHQQASLTVEKIKVLSSSTAIKYMEEDLMKIEKQVEVVSAKKAELENRKPAEINKVIARIKYFVEHLEELLLKQIDPIKKAQFFGTIFDQAPTYLDLKGRTQKTPLFTGVNPLFALANNSYTSFGDLEGS